MMEFQMTFIISMDLYDIRCYGLRIKFEKAEMAQRNVNSMKMSFYSSLLVNVKFSKFEL